MVSFLVSTVKVDTNLKDKCGYTARDLAKSAGHQTIVDYLKEPAITGAKLAEMLKTNI